MKYVGLLLKYLCQKIKTRLGIDTKKYGVKTPTEST